MFAGAKLGARVLVGDGACVRERCVIGDDVVIGRGSLVENDTTVGARTTIQAHAYVTAYSTRRGGRVHRALRRDDERQLHGPHRAAPRAERRGPTIRRGARVGGGAVLCPGIEIGEEAFVGAGAVVTKDVPPRKVVVGNPARVIRDVADDELLGASAAPTARIDASSIGRRMQDRLVRSGLGQGSQVGAQAVERDRR